MLKRIRLRAQLLRLAAWQDGIESEMREVLERSLGMRVPDAWLADAVGARCLRGLSTLTRPFRELAGRVLSARERNAWRGHLDDPANDRWLARARAAGIDTDAWLRGAAPGEAEHPTHGRLVIDLERDPLEILKIGAWFKTCLSPMRVN